MCRFTKYQDWIRCWFRFGGCAEANLMRHSLRRPLFSIPVFDFHLFSWGVFLLHSTNVERNCKVQAQRYLALSLNLWELAKHKDEETQLEGWKYHKTDLKCNLKIKKRKRKINKLCTALFCCCCCCFAHISTAISVFTTCFDFYWHTRKNKKASQF